MLQNFRSVCMFGSNFVSQSGRENARHLPCSNILLDFCNSCSCITKLYKGLRLCVCVQKFFGRKTVFCTEHTKVCSCVFFCLGQGTETGLSWETASCALRRELVPQNPANRVRKRQISTSTWILASMTRILGKS